MAPLSKHQSANITKMILIGESGTGKTGSLVSLVKAGFKLRILDMDNGIDVLKNLVFEQCPDKIDNVDFITVTDKFKNVGGKATPINSDAWARAIKYLTTWTNDAESIKGIDKDGKPVNIPINKDHPDYFNLGNPSEWGPDTILVIDSFTHICNAAMRYILKLNSRPVGPVYESDWGEAQALVENLLSMLYDKTFNTNVIVCAHIAVREDKKTKEITAFPAALGKALPPKVGQYFNSMLEVRRSGAGNAIKRTIHTVPAGLLDLKNPNPLKVKPSYDISTGLAEFFAAVRG